MFLLHISSMVKKMAVPLNEVENHFSKDAANDVIDFLMNRNFDLHEI